MEKEKIIEIKNLKKHFPVTSGIIVQRVINHVRAVDGLDFSIYKGETLGLVGESGCGKSTTGRTILQLYKPTEGSVIYKGVDLAQLDQNAIRPYRKELQMVFQDPYASLNSRMTVASIVSEPYLNFNKNASKKEAIDKVRELISMVGLNPDFINRYPHEFSGGQRQRIGIARALASSPEFIVCDEPISALDVSIQAQVVNLMHDLQQNLGLTYLFIAHDLSMVRYISDRIAVMYLGKIMELATQDELFNHTLHPYTEGLLSAVPIPDPLTEMNRSQIVMEGDIPSPTKIPSGCRFHTRCAHAMPICKEVEPELVDMGNEHFCACHLHTK